MRSVSGQINASTVVYLAIGFLLMAILAPIALSELYQVDTTGWNAAVATVFTVLLPILFIIGLAIRYVPRGGPGQWIERSKFMKFVRNTRGQIGAGTIAMLTVAFLLVAILTPIAMNEITRINTSGWNTAVATMFTVLLPILFVIGIAIRYVPRG